MTPTHRAPAAAARRVTVFAPDPLLSVTIESLGGRDDLHVHAAGQGVWVARMLGEMGARATLCGLAGGETGDTLRHLLAQLPLEARLTAMAGPSGAYVVDRRRGSRQVIAGTSRPAPTRHELDDLVTTTCADALASRRLVLCNPYPGEGFPLEAYDTVASAALAGGVEVLADLSSPRLEQVLPHRPWLVKLNDWELATHVVGPVDGARALSAARRLQQEGARNVAVTRAGASVLVVPESRDPFEIEPPTFVRGFREGCGDAMMGALAAGRARGLDLRDALVLGAAAGTVNFLRHGLGSGQRGAVETMRDRVIVRRLPDRGQLARSAR